MPSKIYVNPETTIKWQDSGADELMTLASLGAGAGRNGAMHNWGAAARASRFHIKFTCRMNGAAMAVSEAVRVYIKEGGLGTSIVDPTNDDGTGDVALSNEDKTRNLLHVATLVVDEDLANIPMSVEAIFETAARHFGPVVFNDTAEVLHATAANNYVEITPIPDEAQ